MAGLFIYTHVGTVEIIMYNSDWKMDLFPITKVQELPITMKQENLLCNGILQVKSLKE